MTFEQHELKQIHDAITQGWQRIKTMSTDARTPSALADDICRIERELGMDMMPPWQQWIYMVGISALEEKWQKEYGDGQD